MQLNTRIISICLAGLLATGQPALSQQAHQQGIYVDKQGVIRWLANQQEASFFGVNYTTPFAYGYRSHRALGIDPKQAIDADVYHLARLGLDAFRVHVWDTEITDSLGNLLNNEHLALFDYLVAQLKKRHIKILLTPIAFWGNGYPERDEQTPGFSSIYNKQQALVQPNAIQAQENYLRQFFKHVNPLTGLTYTSDPDVIAMEVNNEPHHSGPKANATAYINRLAAAVRSTGWSKPVFYNISESPWYADAVSNADIDGVSFQWYPTGLVSNHALQGNLLPNVDVYRIPFDTVPAYRTKARMVYEFDAGDVWQPILYPAMARSFRTAGFQWATQFAYDPMYTAYANTEYQTHYLNLAYTPAKAISLLIAGKVFHRMPRLASYGAYPADTSFAECSVSYSRQLSLLNTATEFYYSNTHQVSPVDAARLQHIAGVGSSPLVQYKGTGAYFLDQLEAGVWRLEVMPDAIPLRDPFEKASPSKEVMRVQWSNQYMDIQLPGLDNDFTITGLNKGNTYQTQANSHHFTIAPGTYLLVKKGKDAARVRSSNYPDYLGLPSFAAPAPVDTSVFVYHQPYRELSPEKPAAISAIIAGTTITDTVWLEGNRTGGRWFRLPMLPGESYQYTATVPAALLQPGQIRYRIVVPTGNTYKVFPGNYTGDPHAWDAYPRETWSTYIAADSAMLTLFEAGTDQNIVLLGSRNSQARMQDTYTAGDRTGALAVRLTVTDGKQDVVTGFQYFIAGQLQARQNVLPAYGTLVLRARVAGAGTARARVALITGDAGSFAAYAPLTNTFRDIELPLQSFTHSQSLLLPRPYPGFMPLWFTGNTTTPLTLSQAEKLEITNDTEAAGATGTAPYTIEIESVSLKVK